jgi:chromosome segregation ATPase
MKNNSRNHRIFLPAFLLLILMPAGLTACTQTGNPADESGLWVSLVMGILLLLAYAGLLIYLWRAGKLSTWFNAGITAFRLKTQGARLKGELKSLDRDKSDLLDELGEKAWAARVSDPSYESAYNQLLTVQGQIDGATDHRRSLEEKKVELAEQRKAVGERFGQQIDALKSQQAAVEHDLNDAKNRVRALEADLDAASQEKARFQRDVKDTRGRIIELERTDDPDKGVRLVDLNSRLNTLTTSLLDATNAEPELAAQLPGLQNQALAFSTQFNDLQGQIQALEGDLKSELLPLDDQLEALEKQIKTKTSEIKSFDEQLGPMAKSLGAQVEKARPLSPDLTELYQKLDMILSKVDFKAQAKEDISSNLGTVDKTASLNFYVLLLIGVLIIVLAILLLTGVI